MHHAQLEHSSPSHSGTSWKTASGEMETPAAGTRLGFGYAFGSVGFIS